jgi:glycosyltransferase involved in cell wall biosynthesis
VLIRNFPIIDEFASMNPSPQQERELAFAYIGVIADIRGAKEMVAAVAEFPAETQVRLKFAGNYSPPGLRGVLERMPGWKSVDSLGWLARQGIVDLLGRVRAGLVVLQPTPNYIESLPVKLFEYLAAGIPVVASDFPIWREIVEEAACGLLVDPTDAHAIADAMRWIIDHPDEAEEMGRRGAQLIASRYNWSMEFLKLDEFYETLDV